MDSLPTTICVKCRWHRSLHPGTPAGPSPDTWFHHVCAHPDVERPTTIDPVTGKTMYMSRNDLGKTVLHNDRHPNCRDINDGNCSIYEAAGGAAGPMPGTPGLASRQRR